MTEPSYEELKARLSELEKQVETQEAQRQYGIPRLRKGRCQRLRSRPVSGTLYYEQWTRLLDAAETLRQFLEENKEKLKLKST